MPSEGNPNQKSSDQIQQELDAIETRNRERDAANAKLQQKMEEAIKALGASTGSGADPSASVPPESEPPLPAERAKEPLSARAKATIATGVTVLAAALGIGSYATKTPKSWYGGKSPAEGGAPSSKKIVQTDAKKETNAPGYTASAGTDAWTLGPKQRAETNPILTELKEYAPNIPKTPEQPSAPKTNEVVVEIGQRTPPAAITNAEVPEVKPSAPANTPAVVDPAPTIPSQPVNLPPKVVTPEPVNIPVAPEARTKTNLLEKYPTRQQAKKIDSLLNPEPVPPVPKPLTAEEKIRAELEEKYQKKLSDTEQELKNAKKQLADIEAAKYKPPTTEERLREIARKLKVREERKPGEPRLPKDIITGEDQDFWNNNAK